MDGAASRFEMQFPLLHNNNIKMWKDKFTAKILQIFFITAENRTRELLNNKHMF
jgi:hypothetical protein